MAFEFFSKRLKEPESETVENEEKARRMAEAEDLDRELLADFKEYCADPAAFRAAEKARVEEAKSEGIIIRDQSDDFMYLYQAGVRAEHLEGLAEQAGEDEGEVYDMEKNLEGIRPITLKIYKAGICWWRDRVSKALDIAFDRAGDKLDLSRDPRGIIVAEKLQRLGAAGDPDVLTYLDLYRKFQLLDHEVESVEAELRRQGPEGAAA